MIEKLHMLQFHFSVTVETANRDVKLPSPWEQEGM